MFGEFYKSPSWSVISNESATIVKLNSTGNSEEVWNYEDFAHLRLLEVGTPEKGTRSVQETGYVVNVATSKLDAVVQVFFEITSKGDCKGNNNTDCEPITKNYSPQKTFIAPRTVN